MITQVRVFSTFSAFALLLALSGWAHAQSLEEGLAAFEAGRYETASTILGPFAEDNAVIAQLALALMYEHGQGVPMDRDVATAWMRRAAEHGQPHAQYEMGIRYYQGNTVPRDFTAARQWWSKAAEQGLADAQFNVGLMATRGIGGRTDTGAALRWYQLAAEQDHALAAYAIGVLLSQGHEDTVNNLDAREWFARAADQDVAQSHYNLGVLAESMDPDAAVRWYRHAARQGLPAAARKLEGLAPEAANDALPLVSEAAIVPAASFEPVVTAELVEDAVSTRSSPPKDGVNRAPWIRAQVPTNYTVQLATVVDEQAIIGFLLTEKLPFETAYFPIDVQGRRRYSAIMGSFDKRVDAQAALESLAPRLRRARPWVRKLESVTRLITDSQN